MTTLPVSDRFFAPEITKAIFVPTIASATLEATKAEIDGGVDLSDEIADIAGWSVATAPINTPSLGTRFVSNIPGRRNPDASSITFYGDLKGEDIRTVLTPNLKGYILWADGGLATGSPADIFPIRVSNVSKLRTVGDSANQIRIDFAITREPKIDYPLPA